MLGAIGDTKVTELQLLPLWEFIQPFMGLFCLLDREIENIHPVSFKKST